MKATKILLLFLGIAQSMSAMDVKESKKPGYTVRNQEQQLKLDRALYELFMTPNWSEQVQRIMEEGQRLIQQGAQIRGPVALTLGEHESTFLDVAVNVFIRTGNILPLILLLHEGVDITRANPQGQTPFFSIVTSNPNLANIVYPPELLEQQEFRRIIEWPQGPVRSAEDLEESSSDYQLILTRQWLLDWLIEQGADINMANNQGNTPLEIIAQRYLGATFYRQQEYWSNLFQELIRSGATIDQNKEQVINAIKSIYSDHDIIQKLLFGQQVEALEALKKIILLSEFKKEWFNSLFVVAAARGDTNIIHYLLEQARDFIPKFDIFSAAIVYAAQAGNKAMLELLLSYMDITDPNFTQVVNEALLTTAARGYSELVDYLTSPAQWHSYTQIEEEPPLHELDIEQEGQEYEESEEPPRKKRKLVHYAERPVTVSYEPTKYFRSSILYSSITRAALRGHSDVLRILLRYVYRHLIDEQDIRWFGHILTRALQLAIEQRHSDVISFLLDYDDRMGHIINLQLIVSLLQNILSDPFLTGELREQYAGLLRLLATRRQLQMQMKAEERVSLPQRFFQNIPPEVWATILTYFYSLPYKSP